jgi:hypothetical protein
MQWRDALPRQQFSGSGEITTAITNKTEECSGNDDSCLEQLCTDFNLNFENCFVMRAASGSIRSDLTDKSESEQLHNVLILLNQHKDNSQGNINVGFKGFWSTDIFMEPLSQEPLVVTSRSGIYWDKLLELNENHNVHGTDFEQKKIRVYDSGN